MYGVDNRKKSNILDLSYNPGGVRGNHFPRILSLFSAYPIVGIWNSAPALIPVGRPCRDGLLLGAEPHGFQPMRMMVAEERARGNRVPPRTSFPERE